MNDDLTTELVTAINASDSTMNAIAFYGDILEVEEIEESLSSPEIHISTSQDVDEDIYRSTLGYYGSGTANVFVIAATETECINKMTNLIRLGYTNNEGRIGQPPDGPFEIGGVDFLQFKPLDIDFKTFKFGQNRIAENAFEFIMKRSA